MQMSEPVQRVRAFRLAGLHQDLSYAIRRVGCEPGFAATAIGILAVGIGICTATFCIIETVLLRPYDIDAPQRVVMMWPGNVQHHSVGEFTYNAYKNLRRLQSFEEVASVGSVNWGGTLTISGGDPITVPCGVVSATFFDVLRARPLLGRTFRPDDDQPSSPHVLVLSHALWTQYYGADPGIVGRSVVVREEGPAVPFEIVGVMPAAFFFPRGAQYWTPAAPRLAGMARQRGEPVELWFDQLGLFYGIGRLNPVATAGSARAETVPFLNGIAQEHAIDLTGVQIVMTPLLDHIFGPARHALLVLMGAVTVVWLIGCTNVAGLLFARGASQAREMAVRAALGASRWVLVRQLLTESALLAACGTVAGVSVAALAIKTLVGLSPADIPRLDATALDGHALLFSIVIAAATTLLVGLAPAARISRASVMTDLKGSATGVAGRGVQARTRRTLVASQVGGTLVLLVAAGLSVKSFTRLARLDLGFDPANVLTFSISGLDETRYPRPSQRDAAVEALLSRFERRPQVIAAGAVFQRPFEHGPVGMDSGFLLEGQPDTPDSWNRNPMLNWEAATSGYFRAMGIRLVRGRAFNQSDTEDSPPVVVVSEAMAARVWPGDDPLGKRLRTNASEPAERNPPRWQTVVGVVATARYREIDSPRLDVYLPLRQASDDVQHFTLRTAIDPLAAAPTIGAEIAAFDAGLRMGGITTMEAVVRRTRGPWRFNMLVFSVFSAVAVALAAVGLFGLVAYEVHQRTREIGVRMALGAAPGQVVRLMVSQNAAPVAAGLVVGLLSSLLVTRLLSGILFGISPTDPATFAEVIALLVVVMTLASYLPARRAASVDPQIVLREG